MTPHRLHQALFALRGGVHRLMEADPEAEVSIPDDLPEELAAVREAIVGVARRAREAESLRDAAHKMVAGITARAARFDVQAHTMRLAVCAALDALDEKKLVAPDFTLTLRAGVASVVVTDETKIPEQFWKSVRTLDKAALRDELKEGVVVPGAELSNGATTLMIRGT